MRRYFDVRAFEEKDLKYVYADHRMRGGEEIDPEVFAAGYFGKTQHVRWMHSILDESDKLVGIIFQGGTDQARETHAHWMQWASPRDILTGAVTFAEKMRRRHTILLVVPESIDGFADVLRRYGLFRRVGKIFSYYEDKSEAFVWQSRDK